MGDVGVDLQTSPATCRRPGVTELSPGLLGKEDRNSALPETRNQKLDTRYDTRYQIDLGRTSRL